MRFLVIDKRTALNEILGPILSLELMSASSRPQYIFTLASLASKTFKQ